MKTFIVIACIFLVNFVSLGQSAEQHDPQNMKVETTREPYYPEGDQVLTNKIYYGMKYSEEARTNKIEANIMVSFFVETDSSVSNINIMNDPGYGVGDSVKVLLGKEKFIPALMNGTPYKTQMMVNLPVRAR